MRNLIALAIGLLIAFSATAQSPTPKEQEQLKKALLKALNQRKAKDSIKQYYESLPVTTGVGNKTFSDNIKIVQSYFINKRTLKQFESTLHSYERSTFEYVEGGYSPEIAYVIDGYNSEADIIRVSYTNISADGKSLDIQVEFGLDNIIKTICFRVVEDDINTDKIGSYIAKIKTAGYDYDIASTRIANRYAQNVVYAKNSQNKVKVRLLPSEYGTLITVMRGK